MTLLEGLTPPYSTIVVDPPWPHGTRSSPANPWMQLKPENRRGSKAKGTPYSSMSLADIRALPLDEVAADDCRLFLWITNKFLRYGWDILEAWGFKPQDRTLVWCKTPRGTMPITTEFILIGRRGRPDSMPNWHKTTWFNWPLQGKSHSAKPPQFLDLVESWCPGPYLEMFARQQRLGWDSTGLGYEDVLTSPSRPVS